MAFLGKWLKKKEPVASPAPVLAATAPAVPMESLLATGAPVSAVPDKKLIENLVSLSRPEIFQLAWKPGFSGPGSARFIVDITLSLRLDSSKSMLDLHAGLGGAMSALTDAYKTYVTGFERDKEIADAAVQQAARSGKKEDIRVFDPLTLTYDKRVDGILARELFYTVSNKDMMMKKMVGWMKPKGSLIITDFAAEKDVLDVPAVAQWMAVERYGVYLAPPEDMASLLLSNGFDLRVSEDMTVDYRREVVAGLAKLSKSLEGQRLNPATKARVGDFVEFWARRAAALDSGVKMLRYFAIKKT